MAPTAVPTQMVLKRPHLVSATMPPLRYVSPQRQSPSDRNIQDRDGVGEKLEQSRQGRRNTRALVESTGFLQTM